MNIKELTKILTSLKTLEIESVVISVKDNFPIVFREKKSNTAGMILAPIVDSDME